MYNEKMHHLGSVRSVIRELFEFGKKRAQEVGADKVYDFSLGNPSVPAPACVNEAIVELVTSMPSTALHGYTSAQGDASVRGAIAGYINERFGTKLTGDSIYMTVGAAASLCITLRALSDGKDEFITVAPFFPEYTVFIGGSSSFDLVPAPHDKYYALSNLCAEEGYSHDEVLYVGDDYREGGNDESVAISDIAFVTVDDYTKLPEILSFLF